MRKKNMADKDAQKLKQHLEGQQNPDNSNPISGLCTLDYGLCTKGEYVNEFTTLDTLGEIRQTNIAISLG